MDSPNKRIIFTEKADIALSEIIKLNGLQETKEQALKILQENKQFALTILIKAIRNFAQNSIPEKDLVSSLQKDLAIPQEKSERLVGEIKLRVVPLLETIQTRPETQEKEAVPAQKSRPAPTDLTPEIKKPAGLPTQKKEPEKTNPIIKKSGPDIYNEPLA